MTVTTDEPEDLGHSLELQKVNLSVVPFRRRKKRAHTIRGMY